MVNPHLIFVVCTQQISCDIRNLVGRKTAGRFKNVTTSEVNEVINNAVPENTKKATKFAVKIFNGQCINFYCLHFCSRTGKLQLSKTIMQLFQPIFVASKDSERAITFFSEWFSQQTEFSTPLEDMEKSELAKCLERFYLSARQKDGGYYKATSLRGIRAGLDRYL